MDQREKKPGGGLRRTRGKFEAPRAARTDRRGLQPWMLVLTGLMFYGFCFHLWTEPWVSLGRIVTLLALSLGFSLLCALLGSVSRRRWLQLSLALAVTLLWGLLYLTEYFIFESFKNFYTLRAILAGGGNALESDFAERTRDLLLSNLWRILLFLLPFVLYFTGNALLKLRPLAYRRYLAVLGLLFLAVGLLLAAAVSPDSRRLGTEYEFTEAVHSFGLPAGFVLEELRGGSGSDFELEDATEFSLPSESNQASSAPESSASAETEQPEQSPESQSAETEAPQPEPGKPYNLLSIDFDGVMEQSGDNTVGEICGYLKSVAPSNTNDMTGLFAGKNLILISAEAFSGNFIDPELTPTLYRMMTQGIQFTDYYQPAWGGSTSSGEFSILMGIEPALGADSFDYTLGKNVDITVSNQLQKLGYFTRAYHNHSSSYYDRDKTHENLGYEKFIAMGTGMEEGVTEAWPESDREMFDFTVPQYIDRQPFSVYYMTVSGHGLYSWGGNAQSQIHREEVENLPYSETVKAYIACNLELEYAMASLLEQLEAAGIAEDTLVVISADHYPYCLSKSDTWYTDKDYLSEYYGYEVTDCFGRDRNTLIMWSACLEDMDLVVDGPTGSLDILPTLCNLFGLDYDSRLLVGRDVFSKQEALVFWPDHSWKTEKGQWNAANPGNEFTPVQGEEISQAYLEKIRRLVNNKLSYSQKLLHLKTDFFQLIFDHVE